MVRRESTVCRLESASSRRSICVKMVHPRPNGTENSASLFAALCHYHARSDHQGGFTVPQPFGWVPQHRAVIMEWVEGLNFNDILKRERWSARRRHEHIRKAAGWLRWFHGQSEMETASLAKRIKLKGIVTTLDNHAEVPQAMKAHDPTLREFLEVARNAAKYVRATEMDFVDLHGDFKLTNLLISSSGQVVGIDFKGEGRGAISHDICRFLSDLDFHLNLVGRSFALEKSSPSNNFTVFLAAYGGRMTKLNREPFLFLYFLTILRGLVQQRRKFTGGIGFRLRQAVMRRLAKKLSREVARGLVKTP